MTRKVGADPSLLPTIAFWQEGYSQQVLHIEAARIGIDSIVDML